MIAILLLRHPPPPVSNLPSQTGGGDDNNESDGGTVGMGDAIDSDNDNYKFDAEEDDGDVTVESGMEENSGARPPNIGGGAIGGGEPLEERPSRPG